MLQLNLWKPKAFTPDPPHGHLPAQRSTGPGATAAQMAAFAADTFERSWSQTPANPERSSQAWPESTRLRPADRVIHALQQILGISLDPAFALGTLLH